MDLDHPPPYSARECVAFAHELIGRAEHTSLTAQRLEHLTAAQAWAALAIAAGLCDLRDALAPPPAHNPAAGQPTTTSQP